MFTFPVWILTRRLTGIQTNKKFGIFTRLPEREEALVINVLDAAGKLVKTFNFNSVEKQASLQINVEDLATGVYQLLLNGNTYSTSARLNVVR